MIPSRPRRSVSLALALALPAVPGCSSHSAPAEHPTDAAVPLRPPAAPADLLAVAHLGHPRSTAAALGTALGRTLPVDLALALGLGVDVSVLSAADTARPVDVALVGSMDHPAYVMAFTPETAPHARAALAPRYRFTGVPGLGERLEPRGDPGLSGTRRLPCALVPVPGPVASRVVCASDAATLAASGRWIAYLSDHRADDPVDAEVTAEGAAFRDAVVSRAVRGLTDAQRAMAESAAAARRTHPRPPDLGDPEVVATQVGALAHALEASGADITHGTLRLTMTDARVDLRTALTVRADGASPLATDIRSRVGVSGLHPLARLLPPDAVAAMVSRVRTDVRRATLEGAVDTVFQVLGDRVTDNAAARADVRALLAHTDDAAALGVARDAPDGAEITVVLSQSDGGAAAMPVLSRLAHAPWLRGVRLGGAVTVAYGSHGALVVTLGPGPGHPLVAGERPRALAVAVRGGALVCVMGRNAASSLEAMAGRIGGAPPGVLGIEPASVMAGVDLAALGTAPGGDATELTGTWDAHREPDGLVATGRLTLPTAALGLLTRVVTGVVAGTQGGSGPP